MLKLFFLMGFLACGAGAAESLLLSGGGGVFTAAGSYKSILSYRRLRQEAIYPFPSQGLSEQRLRLQGGLTWRWLRLDAAHETSFFLQSRNDPRFPLPAAPRPGLQGDWRVLGGGHTELSHRLDRATAQVSLGPVDVTVGRQVLSGGVGQFFSAVAQAPRHPFVTVDPEYNLGRDGVLVAWRGPVRAELAVLARGEAQRQPDFHLRVKHGVLGYDAAVVGGRSDDKAFVGVEAAGNLGDSLLRAELAAYEWRGSVRWQGLAGIERVLTPTFSARLEIFHNGFGGRAPYELGALAHRFAPFRGLWYLAAGATWDFAARWKATATAIGNLLDPSALAQLSVSYSWAKNLDFTLGQYLGVALRSDGEFGGRAALPGVPVARLGVPDLTYAEMKVSF